MGSDAARWVALVALVPALLVSNALGGISVLAHRHDGHGLHVHAADSMRGAEVSAANHLAWHAFGRCTTTDEDPGEQQRRSVACPDDQKRDCPDPMVENEEGRTRTPGGVRLSLPDDDQLPRRGADADLSFLSGAVRALVFIGRPPDVMCPWRGGPPNSQPPGVCGLRPSDRLMRTSRALLL